MKILAISDIELPKMQNVPYLRRTYSDVSMVISCGDLPAAYIEFVTSVLNVPLFYVRGNHDESYAVRPPGGENLHQQFTRYHGLTLAGLEGCLRYNKSPIQYSEFEMRLMVLQFAPGMLRRRLLRGYGVDVLVTHAPPRGIHDREDRPHTGFKSLLMFMQWYRPRYLIHGHVDVYDRRETTWTKYLQTEVVNIDPVRLLEIDPVDLAE